MFASILFRLVLAADGGISAAVAIAGLPNPELTPMSPTVTSDRQTQWAGRGTHRSQLPCLPASSGHTMSLSVFSGAPTRGGQSTRWTGYISRPRPLGPRLLVHCSPASMAGKSSNQLGPFVGDAYDGRNN